MRSIGMALLVAAALVAATGCGDGDDGGESEQASRPSQPAPALEPGAPPTARRVDPAVRRFRRRMAAACRGARRDVGAEAAITSLGSRVVQARREQRAYVRLRERLDRLERPPAVRGGARRYVRYVEGAVVLAGQVVEKASAQQQRQVRQLVRALDENVRRRDRIADGLRVAPC